MPARRMRTNRLPVAPPPLRHRVHSPSGAPRESSLDRVRRIAREHKAQERPFDPERRGSWQGSSRDLVVNPARARRGAKHVSQEPSEDFLVIEESEDDRYPFVLVNPLEYDSYMQNSVFAFAFGAYGWTRLIVWQASDHVEDALETAGEWLAEHAPGILMSEEEVGKLVDEAKEENPELGDEDAFQEATQDLTYTESGWIPSWEWTVSEFTDGDLYDVTLAASKEEYEREYGEEVPNGQRKNGAMEKISTECRIFLGSETNQINGIGGKPAHPGMWYWEPTDYDGDVLWSVGFDSRAAAKKDARAHGFLEANR